MREAVLVDCAAGTAEFSACIFPGNRLINDRNSSRLRISATAAKSQSSTSATSQSNLIGTSKYNRATSFVRYADSLPSRNFRPAAPGISSRCAYIVSRSPYCCNNFTAVFCPTPGTPGKLSLESPISDFRSKNCSVFSPYFSSNDSGVNSWILPSPFFIANTFVSGDTTCKASRSEVIKQVSIPLPSASRANVAMISSAS